MPLDPFASAAQMLASLARREISASELLEFHLRRIERHNPRLNAVVTLDVDRAREAAAAADAARQAPGEERRLLGLPLTVKECLYVAGLPTTGGLPERAETIAEADAAVAVRLHAAGAVIMGKTNVPPNAADWQSSNPLFGRTNNPWDLGRTPGGSSGGSAAAVAAGLSPLEFGGDLGGSIRIPAAFCGVYGHKASETALPRSGHYPGLLLPNPVLTMSSQGPLARTAEDLELALGVISGPEAGEEVAWRLELPPPRAEKLLELRVAILPQQPWLPLDDEIGAALEEVAGVLRRAGARVGEAYPEGVGSLRAFYQLYLSLIAARSNVLRTEEERQAEIAAYRARGDALADTWMRGLEAGVADYIRWHGRREQHRATFRAFFRDWDLLLAPADLVTAFPHTDLPMRERTVTVNGQSVDYQLQLFYPGLANLTGLPATAFPAGLTRAGLPIGLQAIGPDLEDRTPIRFAALLASEWRAFQPPPGFE
jgi:amidase